MMINRMSLMATTMAAAAMLVISPAVAAQDRTVRAPSPPPERALGGYIKIPDIDGESTDNDHKDWIILESMSWPTAASASDDGQFWFESLKPGLQTEDQGRNTARDAVKEDSTATGSASGKHQHKPLAIVKRIDKSSPIMMHRKLAPATKLLVVEGRFDACEPGKHYPQLEVGQDGKNYQLHNVHVEGCSKVNATSGDADDRPTEEVAFYYNKIAFSYERRKMVR